MLPRHEFHQGALDLLRDLLAGQSEPAGQSCSDGDVCNGVEECDGAGACQDVIPALDCVDDDPCSQDSCDPVTGCSNLLGPSLSCDEAAGRASLALDVGKGKAAFSWQKGSVAFEDLGSPAEDTDYALCVYDGTDAPVLRLDAPAGGSCGGKPCWKASGKPGQETGFVYKDTAGASDGVRSLVLKAHEPNPKRELQAGMFIEARLASAIRPDAVVIPEDAILPLQGASFVWVAKDGKATRRQVELGVRRPGFVEARSGVAGGEQVVVAGQERLSEGAPVAPRVVTRDGSAARAASDSQTSGRSEE